MLRTSFLLLAIAATPLTFAQGTAQPVENPVKRVVSSGTDGDSHFYAVYCKNETVATVEVKSEQNETCAFPEGKEKQCQADWVLHHAVKAACS